LLTVAATHGFAALLAVTTVDLKAAVPRPSRQFDLVLGLHMCLDHSAGAVGARRGQGRLEVFVNLVVGQRETMTVPTVVVAAFATGLFRVGFGLSFGEGGSLTFRAAMGFLELFGQFVELGAQAEIVVAQSLIVLAQAQHLSNKFVIGRSHRVLGAIGSKCQLQSILAIAGKTARVPLNKYFPATGTFLERSLR
jgi:hypothetical protein